MKFTAILKATVWLLVTEGRVSYARLRREFDIDDSFFEDIRAELIQHKGLAADLDGQFLVWSPGAQVAAQQSPVTAPRELTPLARNPVAETGTPSGGERRRITVMFCDLMGSIELSTKIDSSTGAVTGDICAATCAPGDQTRNCPSRPAASPWC